ncbi:MAG: C-terminal helicase domain-containing protein, partial [Bacteroidales bacterium]|nr:C-terminal helicase domain-containing protein [Bacteroidales bacterium]
ENKKLPLIKSLIDDKPEYHSILVFSSTKRKVSEIVRGLRTREYSVEGISSDLIQKQREEMVLRFRSKQTRVLVATDVLSRGIDIKDINLVINFDVPSDAEDYVHRVGRTARAETTGVAVTLVTRDDIQKMQRIEKLIEREVYRAPLPAFLADIPDVTPERRTGDRGSRKGGFRRKPSKGGSGRQGSRN